jgi:acyl-CoA thioester hydrolase
MEIKGIWRGDHFIWPMRVYYEDTDMSGYVFHSNYYNYAERARTEYMRSLGLPPSFVIKEYKVHFVVSKSDIKYHAPAFVDDLLHIETYVTKFAKTYVIFEQIIWRDDTKVTKMSLTMPCLNLEGKIVKMPSIICEKIEGLEQTSKESPNNAA